MEKHPPSHTLSAGNLTQGTSYTGKHSAAEARPLAKGHLLSEA